MGVHIFAWDEFSHWGPHAKYMFINHGFVRASDVSSHKSYPPGGCLFYYLSYLIGGFSEAKAYIMQQLLILVTVPVVLKNIKWKNWSLAFLGYLLVLLIFVTCFRVKIGYSGSLYMDLISGIYFGGIIACYRLSDRTSKDILWLIPPVFALSIFKLKLFPLVLLITAIIFLDQFLQIFLFKSRMLKIKNLAGRFFAIVSIPVASLTAIISWNYHTKIANITMEWGLHPTKTQLLHIFAGKDLRTTVVTTIINYKHMLLRTPLVYVIIFTVLSGVIFVFSKQKEDRYTVILDYIVMLFGFVGYLFGLFLMYIFVFGSYEGSRLASVHRYINIYCIAWLLLIVAGLFKVLRDNNKFLKNKLTRFGLIGIAILYIIVVSVQHYHKAHDLWSRQNVSWRFRQVIQNIALEVKKYAKTQDHIFVVWQNDVDYVPMVIKYELIPWHVTGNNSFTKKASPVNVWAQQCSPQEFINKVKNDDYLLLGYTDKEFWEMFGSLFPSKPPKLKPLASYVVCMGKGFNPIDKPGCKLTIEKAYLFKIKYRNDKIQFINVV